MKKINLSLRAVGEAIQRVASAAHIDSFKRPWHLELLRVIRPNGKWQPWWWMIATWFGVGTARQASGTMGSLAALPFAFIIQSALGNFGLMFASLLLFVTGWWATKHFLLANPDQGGDPKLVVVDEVAGQWLVLAVLYPTWQSYLVGFLLFRLFDIVKPWPVCWADKNVKGAMGVMFDDFLAAMYPILVYLCLMLETQLLGSPQLMVPIVSFLSGI